MFRLNPSKIKRLFEKNGFKIKIKTDFIWFPLKLFKPFVNSAWFVNLYFLGLSLLDKLAGRWGHNLTFFAKKTSSS
jgi:hypothetical protein